jgi:hypothetical protein
LARGGYVSCPADSQTRAVAAAVPRPWSNGWSVRLPRLTHDPGRVRLESWSPNTPAGPHCGVQAGRFQGPTPYPRARLSRLRKRNRGIKRPVRHCRQASSSPARHRPGARSARRGDSGSRASRTPRSRRKNLMSLCVGWTTAGSILPSLMGRVRRLVVRRPWRWQPCADPPRCPTTTANVRAQPSSPSRSASPWPS